MYCFISFLELHSDLDKIEKPKMFILISSVMTWAKSKPLDPVSIYFPVVTCMFKTIIDTASLKMKAFDFLYFAKFILRNNSYLAVYIRFLPDKLQVLA